MSPLSLSLLLAGAALASFALSALITALIIPIARRINFVDRPGGHKSHHNPTAYGGGIAIFLAAWLPVAALLAAALWVPEQQAAAALGETLAAYLGGLRLQASGLCWLLAGGVALHVMGLVDDVRPLGAWPKLIVILAVGGIVAGPGGVRLAEFAGGPVSIALTVAWIAVIVNALNFLDNMDGLSAGVAALCLLFLVICGALAGQVLVPGLGCLLLGAAAGFLVFNFPPARIFMGDSGSLLLGYHLAIVSILTTYFEQSRATTPYAIFMPLVVLAVPLYDFATVITIRLREGRSPLRGDQRHFSHRLVDHGLSRRFAVLTIYVCTATTGLAATLLPQADLRETLTIAAIVLLVLVIIAILETPVRKT